MDLSDDFVRTHPTAAVVRGGCTLVALEAADAYLDEVERRGLRVLGMEGFLVAEDAVYPALSSIVDFSRQGPTAEDSVVAARLLVAGGWALPPGPEDQMHAEGHGRHMIDFTVDD